MCNAEWEKAKIAKRTLVKANKCAKEQSWKELCKTVPVDKGG